MPTRLFSTYWYGNRVGGLPRLSPSLVERSFGKHCVSGTESPFPYSEEAKPTIELQVFPSQEAF